MSINPNPDNENEAGSLLSIEIKRLLEAGSAGAVNITPNLNGLSDNEIEAVNAVIRYMEAQEYELLKHKLSRNALRVALWDAVPVEGIPLDPKSKTTWSDEFREMLGFDNADEFPDYLGSLLERIHPDDMQRSLSAVFNHLTDPSGQTKLDIECRLKLKTGEYKYFRAFGETLRNSAGVPLRFAGAVMDINDDVIKSKRLEAAVIEAHEANTYKDNTINAMESILNSIDANIYTTIPETGELIFVNAQMKKEFGIEDVDIIGLYCYKVFRQGYDAMCEFCPCYELDKNPDKRIVWDEYIPERQLHVRHSDCYIKWYDGRTVHLQHAIDITDMMQAQESLKEMSEELKKTQERAMMRLENIVEARTLELRTAWEAAKAANQAKSTFLANMSHEIRTPMNAILGVTEILIQDESLPDEVVDGLDRIFSSCDMLLSIINDLLDFSKIEAGKMDILPAQYKVASLINDAVQLNMMRVYGKPIEFELQIDENTPAILVGDELRIKQILNNLLSNAFKYTENGKVCLSIVTEALPGCDEITLVLIIKDTGRGMTDDQLGSLFEEYLRFIDAKSGAIEGTGLGLVITRGLVSMMNGGIFVESELDAGTTFTVRLPQKLVDNDVLGKEVANNLEQFRMNYVARSRRGQIIRDMMPYGSVLVVDDMESNLYVAAGLLRPYGLIIKTAHSGQATIDLIKDGNEFDVIFMDHMMPEMDGMEATKRLRKLNYTNPIVALTANAVVGQADVFLQNGFDGFISKPIDIRQLNSILNKFIRDKYPAEVINEVNKQTDKNMIDKEIPGFDLLNANINGLDIKRGVKQHDGNEKFYLRVLRSYAASVREVLDDIKWESGDSILDYKAKVHGIKGASTSIFANHVGDLASDLEDAARDEDTKYIEKNNQPFLDTAYKLLDDIDVLISSIDINNVKPSKDKPDTELLTGLLEACKKYDLNEAEEVMEKIDSYSYEADDGLAVWLSEKVNLMGYAQIVEKLTEILK